MTIEDMRRLLENSKKRCPSVDLSRDLKEQAQSVSQCASYLLFNALSTSAWTVWMRINEATSLQYKNLEFIPTDSLRPPVDNPAENYYFKINLRNRKNWQKREKNNEHQLNGHVYNIYPQEEEEIDMYTHLLRWLNFYEMMLGRPLQPNDYLFPTLGAGGSIHPERPVSADVIQKQIFAMAKEAGIPGAEQFTTHCYRRGGAQHRFMFAPDGKRWTLARIRWWGGWAQGEQNNTLIRYLLDELYTYETDHSDALCPNRVEVTRCSTVQREATLQQTAAELKKELLTEIQNLMSRTQAPGNVPGPGLAYPPYVGLQGPGVAPGYINSGHHAQANCEVLEHVPQVHAASPRLPLPANDRSLENSAPNLQLKHFVPELPRNLRCGALDLVVKDWEQADPSRSLLIPLKDWNPSWLSSRSEAVKYGQRRLVAMEFIVRYERNRQAFLSDYPEAARGFGPLILAIRRRQQKEGRCQVRHKKLGNN